jgi:predicted ATPase/DNA-binding XRE family transcriptional regulator
MTTPPPISFGALLRQYRERAGLTQEALAERASVTPQAISALERGERRRPYPYTVQVLAEALHLEADERAALLSARAAQRPAPSVQPYTPSLPLSPALPPSLTPIIGRDTEAASLMNLLRDEAVRIVTLTGPGGVGKTRLALDVAQRTATQFRDGVVWVSLASVSDPALVVPTIAAACGVRDGSAHSMPTVLQQALARKHLLLVLDNFEHLRGAALDVVALLGACVHLTVLATSRAPLHVRGEHEVPLAPLPLPARQLVPHVAEIAQSPAAQLFVARVMATMPTFALTSTNAATVAAICRRLDGLPLALELAAARVKVLGLAALSARLDRTLPLLTGGACDLPARQQTMRATIAWSEHLLDAPTEAFFRRLAVFAGGWTIDAAAVALEQHTATDVLLDGLTLLVDAALVMVDTDDADALRYRMLEPIRQYAYERLDDYRETETIRQRHAAYFVALAEEAQPALHGPMQHAWFDRLDREHNNVRAAMAWALDTHQFDMVTRFGWALWLFWAVRGYQGEARRWMDAALNSGHLAPLLEARTHIAAGVLTRVQGEYAASRAHGEQALATFRAIEDEEGILLGLGGLAQAACFQGDYRRARALAEEGLALPRVATDHRAGLNLLEILGLVALSEGAHAEAQRRFEEVLARAQHTGHLVYLAAAYSHLGVIALHQARYTEANTRSRVGLEQCVTLGQPRGIAYNLDTLAGLAVEQHQWTRAARLFGSARAVRDAAGVVVPPSTRALHEQYLHRLRSHLGASALARALTAGETMPFEQALAYAFESP